MNINIMTPEESIQYISAYKVESPFSAPLQNRDVLSILTVAEQDLKAGEKALLQCLPESWGKTAAALFFIAGETASSQEQECCLLNAALKKAESLGRTLIRFSF